MSCLSFQTAGTTVGQGNSGTGKSACFLTMRFPVSEGFISAALVVWAGWQDGPFRGGFHTEDSRESKSSATVCWSPPTWERPPPPPVYSACLSISHLIQTSAATDYAQGGWRGGRGVEKRLESCMFLVQNQTAWNAVTPNVQEMSLFRCNERHSITVSSNFVSIILNIYFKINIFS